MTTPVTRQTVINRIRRALAQDGMVLHIREPGSRWGLALGDIYVTCARNPRVILRSRCTLEGLVEDTGVLRPGEVLEQETQR